MANLMMDIIALILVTTLKNANIIATNINNNNVLVEGHGQEHDNEEEVKLLNNNRNLFVHQDETSNIDSNIQHSITLTIGHDQNSTNEFSSLLTTIFDWQNIYQSIHCLFRQRDNYGRLQLYLLSTIIFIQLLINYGLSGMLLPFGELVYNWNPQTFSTIYACSGVLSTALMTGGLFLIMKMLIPDNNYYWQSILKLDLDGVITVVAILSDYASNILVGIVLTPLAYYISVSVGK